MADDLGNISIGIKVETAEVSRSLKLFERMKRDLAQLEQARRSQTITDREYNRGLQQMSTRLGKMTGDINNARSAMSKYSYALKQATDDQIKFTAASGKGMRRLEVIAQQAGYQIGDLAVQIQSGTNAAVALGQQGSQLLGFFGPTGALAGAGLAIATAFIAPFIKAKEVANEFKEELDDVSKALELATSGAGSSAVLELNKQIATKTKEIYDLQNRTVDLSYADAQTKEAIANSLEANKISQQESLDILLKDLETLRQKKAQLELVEALAGSEVQEVENLNKAREIEIRQKNLARIEQEAIDNTAKESLKTLNQQNALLEAQIKYGKDSKEVETLKNAQLVSNYRRTLEKKGVDEEIIDALIAQQNMLLINKGIIEDQVAEAKKLKQALSPVEAQYLLKKGILPPQAAKDFETVNKAEEEFLSRKRENARKKAEEQAKKYADALKEQKRQAEELRKELESPLVSAIDSVSNAFGDFISRGLQDFKGFVNQILGSFQSMIAQMIATAARNRIMISLGLGGAGFATGAGAVGTTAAMGGPLGAFIGTTGAAGVAGTGFMGGLTAGVTGGLGNIFSVGANAATAGGGFAATLGAAIPAVAAVAAVVGLLTKKTKLLDSGLRTTVEGFDVAIDTFTKTQSSRLFGLLKGKTVTSYTAVGAELSDPLVQAVGNMQQSIVSAAQTLGIGAEAFDNFSYQFKLSLKGLTEEEQLQKINEEIFKMGDAFASLTGYFSTMNELLAVAQHRYDLTTRLLQLQGNEEELIARYREQERAATHELNQDLLDQIYALEDQQRAVQQLTDAYNEASAVANQAERDLSAANSAYDEATRSVQQAANELQKLLDESLDAALGGLERAIDARKDSINDKYDTLISGLETRLDAANEAASRSAEVYSILSGALSGRSVGGITFASRQAARAYVAGGGTDAERLQAAVNTLSEPSRQLFGSFEDYARDFAITSNILKQSKDAAEAQMTADEKTVSLLEDQIEQAQRDLEDQLRVLDKQLEAAKLQIDALKGIDTTILSVDQAMQNVRDAMTTYEQTQANHVELNTSVLSIGQAISQLASAVSAQAAAQAAAAAAQQAQAAAAAKAAEAQQKLTVAQSGAMTDVNSTAAMISLDTAAKISAGVAVGASEQAHLNKYTGGVRPDHIQIAIAKGYQYDPASGGYKKFAAGGMHSGGLRLVGEQGPELEVTGPSRIYSNSSTRSMLSNPELVAEIKELRREIADTKAEQRAANVAMVKYNKRTSDQLRTWNAVGLPQERTV